MVAASEREWACEEMAKMEVACRRMAAVLTLFAARTDDPVLARAQRDLARWFSHLARKVHIGISHQFAGVLNEGRNSR